MEGVSISFHAFRRFASLRMAFHRIYARTLPPPLPGAGEEREARAGWGTKGSVPRGMG